MAGRAARDMTQGPVFGHILRLLVPMSFGIVSMMLVGIIDSYWVGSLGEAQQAAVQMSFPAMMLVMSVSIGLGAGAVSAVSRAAGQKDSSMIRRLTTDAFTLSLVLVGGVSLLGLLFVEPIFRLIGATDVMLPYVVEYMSVWFAGIFLIVGPMVASNILRAIGNAILPSVMMIASSLVNMVLDPIFILDNVFGIMPGFGWGVTGAALATVAANAVTFVGVMAILIFREKLIDFSWPGWGSVIDHWREIARVGIPAAFSNTFNPLALIVVMGGLGMARFGEAAVAGIGVGGRLEAFAIAPLFALSASIGAVTGQNGGAGDTARVRAAFSSSFLFCVGWSVFIAVLLWLFAGPMAAAFNPESAEAQRVSALYWMLVPITVGGYGITMAASAGFNGLGRPLLGVMTTSGRALGLMAPLAVIGGFLMDGPLGVIIGVAAANLLSGALAAFLVLTRAPMTAKHGRQRRAAGAASAEAE